MKKLLLCLALLSASAFAETYNCEIRGDQLGPGVNMDVTFQVILDEQNASLNILGDIVSESCAMEARNVIHCSDHENMPHTVRILNDEEATLTVGNGMFLPETKASCLRS